MAKVTITLSDMPDGALHVSMLSDPGFPQNIDEATQAQLVGVFLLEQYTNTVEKATGERPKPHVISRPPASAEAIKKAGEN